MKLEKLIETEIRTRTFARTCWWKNHLLRHRNLVILTVDRNRVFLTAVGEYCTFRRNLETLIQSTLSLDGHSSMRSSSYLPDVDHLYDSTHTPCNLFTARL